MISRAYITEWREKVFWKTDSQVEQDLILSRLLVEIFSNKLLSEKLLFRGGTAIYKLYYREPVRYSEDIDLVQQEASAAGDLLSEIRKVCNPFLGKPRWKQTKERVTFYYKVDSEIPPVVPMKFKIEINTREHFTVFGEKKKEFTVSSRWFTGNCKIKTYSLDELLGTKMRALYQRSKGRDLFDLWYGLKYGGANPQYIVIAFRKYIREQGLSVSKKEFLNNLREKLDDPNFRKDIDILLSPRVNYSPEAGFKLVVRELIELL